MALKPKTPTAPNQTPSRSRYARPADLTAQPAPPESAPAESGIKQRGKRGNPEYVQLTAMVPADVRRRFKAKLALADQDMSSVVQKLIEQWLD